MAWIESEGGVGFAVGLAESQFGGSKTPAVLSYYRSVKDAPQLLSANTGTLAYSSLQWRAAK
jgi:hypothetical protein